MAVCRTLLLVIAVTTFLFSCGGAAARRTGPESPAEGSAGKPDPPRAAASSPSAAGPATARTQPGSEPPRSAASPEALAEMALEALRNRDTLSLLALAFNRAEYDSIYPFLKDSKPDSAYREFRWFYYSADNEKNALRHLERLGGRPWRFSSLNRSGEVLDRKRFKYHRGVELWAEEGPGEAVHLRVFRTLVEKDGRWKIWAFLD